MDRTAELRWFLPGPLTPEVRAWFEALDGAPLPPGARTDTYLVPTDGALGVKVREGRLELKRREGEPSAVAYGASVAGRAETWVKWAFMLNGGSDRAVGGEWIDVEKERWMRSYAVDAAGPRAADGRPAPGYCNVELTVVRAAGAPWWTVCLEAHTDGAPSSGLPGPVLEQAAAHIFAQGTPPALPDDASFAYPAWLQDLAPR